jgi:hypothetical protein
MQLVLEQLLEVEAPQRNDYIAAAKTSAATTLQWYDNTVQALGREDHKNNCKASPAKLLEAYVGTY